MPSDDRPYRLDVPELDPPPHLVEQLAEAARASTPSVRRGGRRVATVSLGAVAVFAGVGGAWATGALPVPGLPDGGVPAIVERHRDDAPSDRPSVEPTASTAPTSPGGPERPGSARPEPTRSARPQPSPSGGPDDDRPSARPSPGGPSSDGPASPPTSPPTSPPSASPGAPGRGGENPGRGDDRRNEDPGEGNRGRGVGGGQGQGAGRGQGLGQGNGQDNGRGPELGRGPGRDDDSVRGRGPDA